MRKTIKYLSVFFIISLILFGCGHRDRRNRHASDSSRNTYSQNAPKSRSERSRRSTVRKVGNGKSVVKMKKNNGVYEVPCKINGVEMTFIFDTGASDITISTVEAIFLFKQGKLTEDDFVGTQQYQVADGSIHEGMVINLRTVQIANRELTNVQAAVVDNPDAPLLFGQSALSKFGKISIDYKRKEISFED